MSDIKLTHIVHCAGLIVDLRPWSVREPVELDTPVLWESVDLLHEGESQGEEWLLEKKRTGEAIKQLRKGSEGLH